MKYEVYGFPRDPQQADPVSHCAHCRAEIYSEDICYIIGSEIICNDCLEEWERETRCGILGRDLYDYLNRRYGGLDDIE